MDPLSGSHITTSRPLTPALSPEGRGGIPLQIDTLEVNGAESLTLIPPGAVKAGTPAQHAASPDAAGAAAFSAAATVVEGLTGSIAAQALAEAGGPDSLPRSMTAEEKYMFKSWFPALDVDNAVVTAESTPAYNCISWTVGETHQWFWPPSMYPDLTEEEAFDKFYGSYGFTPSSTGEVARWRNDDGLTHGCVSGPEHGPRWESKCGAELRIQHGLNELEGSVYGKVDRFYTKEKGAPMLSTFASIDIPREILMGVQRRAAHVEPSIRERFEGLYGQWQRFRQEPEVRVSANPADYCKTSAFAAITRMGQGIVPLLMEKMANGDFFCLQALDKMRERGTPHGGPVLPELAPDEQRNSEQSKAALTVMRWLQG